MPGVGPAVGDRPSWGETEHQVFPPGDGSQRHPVGQSLGVRRQVRGDAVLRLHAAEVGAKPGEHLVHDEDDAVLAAPCPQQIQESRLRRDAAGVVMDWLTEHGRELIAMGGDGALERLDVVPGRHHYVVRTGDGHATGRWYDHACFVERVSAAVEPRLTETVEMAI